MLAAVKCVEIQTIADVKIKGIYKRYEDTVQKLIEEIHKIDGPYHLDPIFIIEDARVTHKVLEKINSHFDDYKIKFFIRNNQLYIVNVSKSQPRGAGIVDFCFLLRDIEDRSIEYAGMINVHTLIGPGFHREPDYLITKRGLNLVIFELEISNRSLISVRKDYLSYFEDENVKFVVVVKFFSSTDNCLMQHGVAVQWVRNEDGVVQVDAVRDFGFEPITTLAAEHFAMDLGVEGLPGVLPHVWAENRHVPVDLTSFYATTGGNIVGSAVTTNGTIKPPLSPLLQQVFYNDRNDLYSASTLPILTIPMAKLIGSTTDVTDSTKTSAAPLPDIQLKLNDILFHCVRVSL